MIQNDANNWGKDLPTEDGRSCRINQNGRNPGEQKADKIKQTFQVRKM
jgi:hypothetical protein